MSTLSFSRDLLPTKFQIAGGGPPELDDRRAEPQHLFDGARQQRQVPAQQRELVGVWGQGDQGVRDQVAGGVVAGDHQELEEPVEFALGEAFTVDLGVGDGAPQVVGRSCTLFCCLGSGVGEHLGERGDEQLRVGAVFWVVKADQPVRPAVEQGPVLAGHAQHVGQHQ